MYAPARYKILHGGRGSGKTFAMAEAILAHAERRRGRYVCAREFQESLDESSYATIEDVILMHEWPGWRIRRRMIEHVNGSRIVFRGLARNLASIRSFRNALVCWVDEAQFLRERTWEVVRNTIREAGSELWLSLNPEEPSGAAYKMINDPPPRTYTAQVNWRDNPYFPDELERERREAMRSDPGRYAHIWEGAWDDGGMNRVLPFGILLKLVATGAALPDDQRPQVGFDVSGDGRDRGSLAVRTGPVIWYVEMLDGGTIEQAKRAHELAMQVNASVLAVDAGGQVGATAAAWLRLQDYQTYTLREVLFGDPPAGGRTRYSPRTTNAQQFSRRNAQMWWGLRHHVVGDFADLVIDTRAPQNIPMDQYLTQISQAQWSHDGAMRIRIDKGEPSPDAADATVLAFSEESRRGLRAPGARRGPRIVTVRAGG